MKSILQDFWMSLPSSYAKPAATILFIALLIFIWYLPINRIYEEKPSVWKDLRLWSTLLLVIQILIYFIF